MPIRSHVLVICTVASTAIAGGCGLREPVISERQRALDAGFYAAVFDGGDPTFAEAALNYVAELIGKTRSIDAAVKQIEAQGLKCELEQQYQTQRICIAEVDAGWSMTYRWKFGLQEVRGYDVRVFIWPLRRAEILVEASSHILTFDSIVTWMPLVHRRSKAISIQGK